MAIQTGGFQVQVMPRTDFLDPRLLTPDYTRALTGFNQGLDTVAAVQRMRDMAIARQDAQLLRANRNAAIDAANRAATAQSMNQIDLAGQRLAADRARLGLTTGQDTAAIGRLPLANSVATAELQGRGADLANIEARRPIVQETQSVADRTNLAQANTNAQLQPKKSEVEEGALDLQKTSQKIQAIQQEAQTVAATEARDWVKSHPGSTQAQLEAALLTNRNLIDKLHAVQDLNKTLKDKGLSDANELAANDAYTKLVADVARQTFVAAHGGITPAEEAELNRADAAALAATRSAPGQVAASVAKIGALPAGVTGEKGDTIAALAADPRLDKINPKTGELPAKGFWQHLPLTSLDVVSPSSRQLATTFRNLTAQLDGGAPAPQNTLQNLQLLRRDRFQSPPAALPPGLTPTPTPAAPAPAIPQAAIDRLRANPALAADFQEAFGVDPTPYLR